MVETRARQHLIDFSIATNKNYRPNWHHEIIAKELEDAESNNAKWQILIVMVPPRHGKSEECSINFPAWYLGRNPNKEIITASYSAELAQDFGSKTRNLVLSEVYQSIFKNTTLSPDEQSRAKWRIDGCKGSYTSVGIGGPITGRGANIFLIDDPIKNKQEAESEVVRDSQWGWFTSTAYTRLEPGGRMVIILTRWHLDDLAGRILKNEELAKVTKVIRFPAVALFDEEYRKQGEALWPQRYDLLDLERIKNAIGPYDWSSLYQQSPILSANQEFRPNWIRYREARDIDILNTRKFLTIDTAISKSSKSDNTGICDNAVDENDNWHLRAWKMRINPKELLDLLFILHSKRSYEKIGIEKTIYLQAIEPFLKEEMEKRGVYLPIVELQHNQVNKEVRIRGLIPRYAAGKIFHIEGECKDLEDELFTFPLGLTDDVLDASAYQVQLAEKAYARSKDTVLAPATKTNFDKYSAI